MVHQHLILTTVADLLKPSSSNNGTSCAQDERARGEENLRRVMDLIRLCDAMLTAELAAMTQMAVRVALDQLAHPPRQGMFLLVASLDGPDLVMRPTAEELAAAVAEVPRSIVQATLSMGSKLIAHSDVRYMLRSDPTFSSSRLEHAAMTFDAAGGAAPLNAAGAENGALVRALAMTTVSCCSKQCGRSTVHVACCDSCCS